MIVVAASRNRSARRVIGSRPMLAMPAIWRGCHFTGGFARASRTTSLESVDDLATAITFVRSLSTDADPHKSFEV